ncbi:hypothetical protein NP493_50g05004 [Ridgeia piscesae]|uniref:SHSP domain-containing protein n=1 Tax=Ridgeia piscesae TaxID=27915 RepID=A0AAD9PBR1_RIDPI|nr:hypothetical protein NP493_50g05004 [Ridgeia piscesae]
MAGYIVPFEHPSRRNMWDLWSDPWGADFPAPLSLFEQNFGLGIRDDDLLPPTGFRGWYLRPRRRPKSAKDTGVSQILNNEEEFKVNLDVTHFHPDEITVKTTDNRVVVEGKHEEREDDCGVVQRYFKRIYTLPRGVDATSVKSSLSPDGVLRIAAPKKEAVNVEERQIAIELDGSGDENHCYVVKMQK